MTQQKRLIYLLAAILLISVPVVLMVAWFYACSQTAAYPDNLHLYRTYLPGFLRRRYADNICGIVFCILCFIIITRNVKGKNRIAFLSWPIAILALLLIAANLFSMM